MEYGYAHFNTKSGERQTPTAQFNKPNLDERIARLRESAFMREIPVSDDETLLFLQTVTAALKPENILELGTATGVSGAVMLQTCPHAKLTTVERDENFYREACANFKDLSLDGRVTAISGDAGEIIEKIEENSFDLIFLDCAKVQYVKYLPRLKKLLKRGGTLIADDVLLFGYVTGEVPTPPKRKALVGHVREYLTAVTGDNELYTTVINVGNGVALSVLK